MSVHFSSQKDDWATPQDLFDSLNSRYRFTLDPCSSDDNAKCALHFTKEQDGLARSWRGQAVFMNPPYGREVGKWVKKAYEESAAHGIVVVCLLPSRTDTKWFQRYCLDKSAKIHFIPGRLKFGGSKNSAPFPSMIVVFGEPYKQPEIPLAPPDLFKEALYAH